MPWAEAVAEELKGVARALLYIVRASPSFFIHPSFKTFYHTFYHDARNGGILCLFSLLGVC